MTTARPSDYRAEIDGLRALAVLSVALYHARIPGFSGGYVGVDVFFVISGYLITRIIALALDEGRFSLLEFYERRARRIMPALLVVLAAVTVATFLVKSPKEANLFGESVTFAALMISNVFFYNESGYFGEPVENFALLHTWSLAVEEQFYLVFPLLLMALVGARASWRGPVVLGLTALSLGAAAVATPLDQALAFFITPFRFWELSVGAALALGLVPAVRRRGLATAASALGLALILGAVVFYDEETVFPGLAALPPVLGTALVIHAEAGRRTAVGAMLGLRPVAFVGLCSYSFYLWHWPALSFASYAALRPLEAGEGALVLGAAFAASVLSLYLVERPFRRRPAPGSAGRARGWSRRGVFALTGAGAAALLGAGVFLQETRGWPERFPEHAILFAEDVNRYGLGLAACRDAKDLLPPETAARMHQTFCRFGPEDQEPDLIVWGDSHAMALWPAFREAAAAEGRSGYLAVLGNCPPIVPEAPGAAERFYDRCLERNAAIGETLAALDLDLAILVGAWESYRPPEPMIAATVARLSERGLDTLLVAPAPTYPLAIPSTLFRTAIFGAEIPFDLSRTAWDARAAPVLDAFAAAASGGAPRPRVEILRTEEALCDAERCAIEKDGVPLYSDTNHLNRHGAALLEPAAREWLRRMARTGEGEEP